MTTPALPFNMTSQNPRLDQDTPHPRHRRCRLLLLIAHDTVKVLPLSSVEQNPLDVTVQVAAADKHAPKDVPKRCVSLVSRCATSSWDISPCTAAVNESELR